MKKIASGNALRKDLINKIRNQANTTPAASPSPAPGDTGSDTVLENPEDFDSSVDAGASDKEDDSLDN